MGIFPSDPDRKDVWVPDKVHGYIAAYVVQEKDDQSLCCLATGNTVTVPTASPVSYTHLTLPTSDLV